MLQALGLAFVLAVSPAQASSRPQAIAPSAQQAEPDAFTRGLAAYNLSDFPEAIRWYRLAADQGDARAQFNLGVMYSEGKGVRQDHAEAARWFRLAAEHSVAPAEPAAPPPAPAAEIPGPVIEEYEDGSWRIYEVDTLRPGHPLFDVEMRADCSVHYRGLRVQPRSANEYEEDGNCGFLPTVYRSPSGRWIAVHTPGDHYGYDQIAVVNADTRAVAVAPTDIAREGRLFPLKVWSADENLLLMTEMIYLGPYVGGLTQFSVSVPCEFDIARVSLDCVSKQHFLESLQAAAVRASPLARCLSRRTCYMVMGIRDERLEDDSFAYTGVVQLKSLEGDPASLAEEFVSGEDIVWLEFSGLGPRNTPRDLTMRIVRQ